MRTIRALAVAAAASSALSACVGGLDPQAALRPGSQSALTALPAPAVAAQPHLAAVATPEALTLPPAQPQRVSAAMPGDLLFDPERTAGGINPMAVLTRSEVRYAHAAPPKPAPSQAMVVRRQRIHTAAAGPVSSLPTTNMAAPLAAPPAATSASSVSAAPSTLTPLAEVEAHAAIEQRAQNLRDRRFDAQVRRASNLVCSGCIAAPTRSRRAQAHEPDDAAE